MDQKESKIDRLPSEWRTNGHTMSVLKSVLFRCNNDNKLWRLSLFNHRHHEESISSQKSHYDHDDDDDNQECNRKKNFKWQGVIEKIFKKTECIHYHMGRIANGKGGLKPKSLWLSIIYPSHGIKMLITHATLEGWREWDSFGIILRDSQERKKEKKIRLGWAVCSALLSNVKWHGLIRW